MKSYVITIMDNERSVESAKRCIASGKRYGVKIEMFPAITPQSDPIKIANEKGVPLSGFREKYSRFENCLSAFLSHRMLWELSVRTSGELQIFEHDAVIVNSLPGEVRYRGCMSMGKPSYGKYLDPQIIGVNPLVSKRYFPGAHAYRIKPEAAQILLDSSTLYAMPTDVFLHVDRFPFLEEYYPWPVEALDTFTTIQNQNGCLAKHNYGPSYEII